VAKRSKAGDLIRQPHWRGLRLAAEDALVEDRITVQGIRAIDRWLVHLGTEAGDVVSPDRVLSFFSRFASPTPISLLLLALRAVDPQHPHLPSISQALELKLRSYRPGRPVRPNKPVLTCSVEVTELPIDWQDALADMKAGVRRGCPAPAPSIVVSTEETLRQLAFSAREAGLRTDFSSPSLSAYVHALIARGVASSTLGSALNRLRTFGTYIGAPTEIIHAVREEMRFHNRQASRAGKHKERFLHQSGLTFEDVARQILALYLAAHVEVDSRVRHQLWMRAALLAFALCRPLRPLDVSKLVIGHHLRRDSEGWALYVLTRKNQYKVAGRMWDICTPFLDGAILLGADGAYLWEMYARAEGRPLLADRQGKALAKNWPTKQARRYLGSGLSILRTLWHDHCAAVGDGRAVEVALAVCGQYHPRTAMHYRTQASERSLVAQGQGLLSAIADGVAA